VSTFYLLPPRPFVGECLAAYLQGLFPGLPWNDGHWMELADRITAAAAEQPDVYVVHREELPAGEPPALALVHGFGAEPGDEVVEVRPGPRPGELTSRRWRVGGSGAGAIRP
jgi:hypothetical protein